MVIFMLYYSAKVIRMIKSSMMLWAGYIARLGEKRIA
jgi:hypothetical protein